MDEQQKSPEEQRRAEEQRAAATPRQPRHIARSTEPKEEETQTYVVKEGQTWGTNPELQAGDTVELTEAEAAGFEDKLEPAKGSASGMEGRTTPFQPTPPPSEGTQGVPGPKVPRR
jgi:hypothetical protein